MGLFALFTRRPENFLAAPLVVMPMETWNGLAKKALRFGMLLSPEITAVIDTNILVRGNHS